MHRHARRRALSFRSETELKRSEEFLHGVEVSASVVECPYARMINHIEAPQGGVTVLPANARTFTFNFRRNSLRQLLELVGFLESLRRKSTQNHIRGHSTPPCRHQRSCFRLWRLAPFRGFERW